MAVALVVFAAACSGGGSGQHAASTSTTTSGPAEVAAPPAAGFLSAEPTSDTHSFAVWSWSGQQVGTVPTKAVAECCGLSALSPDGTHLLLSDPEPGAETDQIVNMHGRVLAQAADLDGATWADDSRHLCDLRPHAADQSFVNGPADLVLVDPGHGERVVAQVPGYAPHTGPVILRCSVIDDQAIVAENFMGNDDSITTVQLSTGRTSTPNWSHHDVATVVAVSGNGRYALGESRDSIGSTIVDTRTGAVVGRVRGQPEGISWNGHLVVVSYNGQRLEVVDWRNHADRWLSAPPSSPRPAPDVAVAVSARPDSDDLALAVSDVPGHDPSSAALWLVTPSIHKLVDDAVADGVV